MSNLLLLFQHCHFCFKKNPNISVSQHGTMISVESQCGHCSKTFKWSSQPYLFGRFPAGNILLSFAILCAGGSVRKVLNIFKTMGVLVYNESTFYYHQRHFLFPTIVSFWRSYQNEILKKLDGKEVVLAGDARHDSMGHSAKYGTYTIFCCTVGLMIHITLIQVNVYMHLGSHNCIHNCKTELLNGVEHRNLSFFSNFRQIRQGVAQRWNLLATKHLLISS